MHIYIVRHGETELNARHIHQSPNTPLSVQGKKQIETTAEYLREVNPDFLVSSEYSRALESAQIIGLHVGLKPHVQELWYEIERPSKLFGKTIFNFETLWYLCMLLLHCTNHSWRYKDAENLYDIEMRAKKAQAYLESLRGLHESVIVVSHTIFISTFLSVICSKGPLTIRGYLRAFVHMVSIKNGQVTHLEYKESAARDSYIWRVVKDI